MKWIDKLKQTVKPGDQTKPELHGRDESVPHAEQPVPRADTNLVAVPYADTRYASTVFASCRRVICAWSARNG